MGNNSLSKDYLGDLLQKVRRLQIHSRRLSSGAFSGAYHSLFKGQGMHFEEVREYSPGDDIRSIDWNVTARAGRPFIKIFREERERSVILLLDLSASNNFGSAEDTKRERLAEVASLLGLTALNAGDKLGLLLFTDQVESYIPPKKGSSHGMRLIRDALFFEPKQKGTDLSVALDYLNKVHRKRAVVFLISDFLGIEPSAIARSLSVTSKRHELNTIIIEDPRECTLPPTGLVILEDAETGQLATIDTLKLETREHFKISNKIRKESLEKMLKKTNIPSIFLSTKGDYLKPLKVFLETKRRS